MSPAAPIESENSKKERKKILIVYASAGAGHQKAAEAFYQYLKNNHPEFELIIADILDYTPVFFRLLYSRGYIFVISRLSFLWYLLYRVSSLLADNPIVGYLDYLTALPFARMLKREAPDAVVSTHFLTSSIITVFKNKFPDIRLKFISVITDYNLHPLWIGRKVDAYVAACDYVREELLKRGVLGEKIKVCGIPAKEKFYQPAARPTVAGKLGIEPSKFTFLIITGAIGLGPIEEIAQALSGKMQLLVVCGNNQRLYQRLCRMNLPLVKPFPLIDYVDELMSVSDAVITKAGGLTITESLAKGLPMIFFSSIPGLETANARVISQNGCGFISAGIKEITQTALALKNNLEFYQKTVSNIKQFRKTDTLYNIYSELKNI